MQKKCFNISENSKIYVYCPSGIITGGVELLHQLVDIINQNGGNAFIVYYGNQPHSIPNEYKEYNIKIAEQIIDIEDNILVLPEVKFNESLKYSKIQFLFWWLSVDNFFYSHQNELKLTDLFNFSYNIGKKSLVPHLKNIIKKIIHYKSYKKIFSINKLLTNRQIVYNCYQSEYAKQFLLSKKITNIYPLGDYINDDYSQSTISTEKENIILYNPKKGFDYTKKIIQKASELNWQPIENMTRSQVKDLMKKSKIYIDFGNHPGKDRLPRESRLQGCVVITGKNGSAKYYEDVPIEEKFEKKSKNINDIVTLIKKIFNNYDFYNNKQLNYTKKIKNEKKEFENNVKNIFFNIQNVGGGYKQLTKLKIAAFLSQKVAA